MVQAEAAPQSQSPIMDDVGGRAFHCSSDTWESGGRAEPVDPSQPGRAPRCLCPGTGPNLQPQAAGTACPVVPSSLSGLTPTIM